MTLKTPRSLDSSRESALNFRLKMVAMVEAERAKAAAATATAFCPA